MGMKILLMRLSDLSISFEFGKMKEVVIFKGVYWKMCDSG